MSKQFDKMTIGDRIRYLLEVREYSQVAVADKIGVTQAAISNLVTDSSRKPSAPTLLKLAAALQANADWIITGEGDPFEVTIVGRKTEKELLELFRLMDSSKQAALLATARAMVG